MDNSTLLQARKEYDRVHDLHPLEQWFSARLGFSVSLVAQAEAAKRNGFAGENLFFTALRNGEVVGSYVVRRQPAGDEKSFPPGRSFLLEGKVQAALGRHTSVPVAPILGVEPDESIIGKPFYAMARVEGHIPCDNPGYHAPGIGSIAALPPEDRRALAFSAIESLADLARVDPRTLDVPELWQAAEGQSELAWDIQYYHRFWQWAKEDLEQPLMEEALAWVDRHALRDEPLGVSWGDARYGNVIFQGTQPRALIDWDMVTLGSPEKDLSWWLLMDHLFGRLLVREPLDGWPEESEFIAVFEQRLGRRVDLRRLSFHRVFAAIRMCCTNVRFINVMRRRGVLPREMRLDTSMPAVALLQREMTAVRS